MTTQPFDCLVIGGGPGGYHAAIRARQLGMRAAVVEREHLGGICLNWGCIPTKALLRAAEIRHWLSEASEFGIEVGELRVDLPKVVARSRKVAKRLNAGVKHLLRKNGVEVFEGHARLQGPGRVSVTQQDGSLELQAAHIILAPGARARSLPGMEPDGDRIWTYREAMVPTAMPRSLLIVGSGAIGIEFASFYRDLGVEVTVVEILPRILPAEDAEVSAFARKAFERQGIQIHTEARVAHVEKAGDGVLARVETEGGEAKTLEAERLIVAVGITGNVEDLGLDTTRVVVDRGHIQVDEWCRTAEPGIYAIGDVAGAPYLAHKANHEGILCVEKIAGQPSAHPIDRSQIPGCTYSRPQVASVGMTEEEARADGRALKVGRFPLQGNGKALAVGDTQGFVKTVFDEKTGELLGAHLIGPEVTEMIQGFVVARTLETTEAELMQTIFPHPTISEAMHESVLDAFDRAIHI
ncbi:MAG: dihydrolipoyl dehydrogenase [Myxococcota bacterium]